MNDNILKIVPTIIAAISVMAGLIAMFFPAEIVGGDAYNYIIGAARGTGLICIGLVAAVLANLHK